MYINNKCIRRPRRSKTKCKTLSWQPVTYLHVFSENNNRNDEINIAVKLNMYVNYKWVKDNIMIKNIQRYRYHSYYSETWICREIYTYQNIRLNFSCFIYYFKSGVRSRAVRGEINNANKLWYVACQTPIANWQSPLIVTFKQEIHPNHSNNTSKWTHMQFQNTELHSKNKKEQKATRNLNRYHAANLITATAQKWMSRQTKGYAKLRSLKRGFNQPTPKRGSDWKLTADAIEQASTMHLKSTATPKQLMRLKTGKKAFANRRGERALYKNRVHRSAAKNGTVIPKNKNRWCCEKIKWARSTSL